LLLYVWYHYEYGPYCRSIVSERKEYPKDAHQQRLLSKLLFVAFITKYRTQPSFDGI
jgi:hypothetical protein